MYWVAWLSERVCDCVCVSVALDSGPERAELLARGIHSTRAGGNLSIKTFMNRTLNSSNGAAQQQQQVPVRCVNAHFFSYWLDWRCVCLHVYISSPCFVPSFSAASLRSLCVILFFVSLIIIIHIYFFVVRLCFFAVLCDSFLALHTCIR